jgi:hypothetical protein
LIRAAGIKQDTRPADWEGCCAGGTMLEIYGSTGIIAGIAQTIFLLTAFGVGGLLLSRAHRSGDRHQRLLGWHLILAMGVGYLLLSIAIATIELGIEMNPTLRGVLVGLGNLATGAGLCATLIFTREVFRPESTWARATVWLLAGLMAAGFAVYGLTGGFPSARYDSWGAATMMAGIVGTNVWVSWEPLRYYLLMRRRLKLGLAEPLVVDRFLLWGVGSASRLVLVLFGVGSALFVRNLEPDAALALAKLVLVGTSICGLVASISYWLAFHPTPAYQRWVERRLGSPGT